MQKSHPNEVQRREEEQTQADIGIKRRPEQTPRESQSPEITWRTVSRGRERDSECEGGGSL